MLRFDVFTDFLALSASVFFVAAGLWNIFTSRRLARHGFIEIDDLYSRLLFVSAKNRLKSRAEFLAYRQNFDDLGNFVTYASYHTYLAMPNIQDIPVAGDQSVAVSVVKRLLENYSDVNFPRVDVVNNSLNGSFARGYAHA